MFSSNFNDDNHFLSSPRVKMPIKGRFDLKELVKNHAVKLLGGRGYTLHGKHRKEIAKILEAAHAESFFPSVEGVSFEQGHTIIVIRKTLSGELHFSVPILWGSSNVAKVFEDEQLAVVWERKVFDDANYVMRTTFDTQKTVTSFHRGDGVDGALGEVVNLGESRKIAKSLNIPLVDNHNLGIVPVIFMPNLPRKNFVGNPIMEWYPDDTPSGNKLGELQEHLDKIFDNIEGELDYNRPLVFMGMTPKDQEDVRKDPSKLGEKFNRFIIHNQGMGNNYLPFNLEGQKTAPIDIMQGKPQLEILANYANYTVDRGFNICGYNSPGGTREHATNKTTSEVSINMQNDYLTTSLKKGMREHAYNRLFKKALKVLGIEDGDCRI